MTIKERLIIEQGVHRLKKWIAYRYLIWLLYFFVFSFHWVIHELGHTIEMDKVFIFVLLAIWYSIVTLRPELVLKWQCKLDWRVSSNADSFLNESMRKLAWDVGGRTILEDSSSSDVRAS